MFLYRVKIEELDASRAIRLRRDLARSEETLHAQYPIREMSLVAEQDQSELDIYLALDDIIEGDQIKRLFGELSALIEEPSAASPRVTSEIIHI